MVLWFTSHPIYFGLATFLLMWSDWLLTVLQERERRTHYSQHYRSYPVNTIEGNPALQGSVRRARLLDPKHFVISLVLGVAVTAVMAFLSEELRELFLGYVWGQFLIVDTIHISNLLTYRASRRGLHGKLYLHLRTGYLVAMGRYAALSVLLLVLTILSGSLSIAGMTIAGVTGIIRQFVFLQKVSAIPQDDRPPEEEPETNG